jgi:hypothetical protein
MILINPGLIQIYNFIPILLKLPDFSEVITPGLSPRNERAHLSRLIRKSAYALKSPSVIVLDNASYHNIKTEETVVPSFNQRKAVLP